MDVPDFTYYRRSAVKDPTAKSSETAQDRMAFSYVMAGGFGWEELMEPRLWSTSSSAPGQPHRMCWLWLKEYFKEGQPTTVFTSATYLIHQTNMVMITVKDKCE